MNNKTKQNKTKQTNKQNVVIITIYLSKVELKETISKAMFDLMTAKCSAFVILLFRHLMYSYILDNLFTLLLCKG